MNRPTQPTTDDLQWLTQVMGRPLDGDFQIATRNSEGHPQVLQVYPIIKEKPFPSLYWLCCPKLKKELDHLEARGEIKRFERQIKSDEQLRQSLYQNHRDYIRRRWESLRAEDIARLPNPRMIESLQTKGIGGLDDWDQLRCLHMHYAFHLIAPTLIGQRIDQLKASL